MKPTTVLVTDINSDGMDFKVHIASAPTSGAVTLCGYVDVSYKDVSLPPDCGECLGIVKYCKSLDIPEKRPSRRSK